MKLYSFDMSGLSNPHVTMPEGIAIYRPIWACVISCIESGKIAVTTEIYDEMTHIDGDVGACIKRHKSDMLMEVGDNEWDGETYIKHFGRMRKAHSNWIAEYTFKSKAKTVCLSDLTAIALAKTLKIPVVSMESSSMGSEKHKRIPDVCQIENVLHYSFNDFLAIEGM